MSNFEIQKDEEKTLFEHLLKFTYYITKRKL